MLFLPNLQCKPNKFQNESINSLSLYFKDLQKLLDDSQDPQKVDKILKIHKQIDETKDILYSTIDTLLSKGTKLDDLVNQTEKLKEHSKLFYNSSKQINNRCCILQ